MQTNEIFYQNRKLNDLMATLPESQKRVVRRQEAMAASYVWGWQDAGGDLKNTSSSFDFGIAYAIHATRYAAGLIHSRRPIPEAFKAWREGRNIED